MTLPPQPGVPRRRIAAVMRRLARAIDGLEEPAVEKIAEDQQEDPFQVLDRDDAVGADEGCGHRTPRRRGCFAVARTPRAMLEADASRGSSG